MPILSTKVHPPHHRAQLLHRSRLVEAIATPTARLVLVTGPAGSGKTVAVRQWLAENDLRAGWLTVDPRDNEPARFWGYVGAALTVALPSLDWEFDARGADESLDGLAERLAQQAPIAMVLDDLQFLIDPLILDGLDQLIEKLSDDVRLVLVSRSVPPLRLARRRASGRLVEVVGADLAFTAAETREVLGHHAHDDVVARVQEMTGGWPVVVALAALLPGSSEPITGDWTGPTGRTRRQLADYLGDEVVRTQPAQVQQFLLDTSVLDELTLQVAAAVCDCDVSETLRYLSQHDVFLVQTGGTEADTWRHHALVRDYLRQTLEATDPDRWAMLHRRAARYYAGVDEPERAMSHALAAPDYELAAGLMERMGLGDVPPFARGRYPDELHWMEALPDEVIARHPRLRVRALGLAGNRTRPELVARWLAARPVDEEQVVEELFAKAWRADHVFDMPTVREACLTALDMVEPDSTWWHTMHGGLVDAEYLLGNWDEAVRSFEVLQHPFKPTLDARGAAAEEFLRCAPAVIRARQGRAPEANAALRSLRGWLSDAARLGYSSLGTAAWAEAMVAFYGGDVATATRWSRLPDPAADTDSWLPQIVIRFDLATVRRAAGDTDRAVELLVEIRQRLHGAVDPGHILEWVAAEEAELGIGPAATTAQRSWGPAGIPAATVEPLSERELEVLRLLRSEFSKPEIAAHLFISYNTAKTHTRAIYRKLDVNSRSAAVARARKLGYL